jgi:hypothetical protein
LDADVASLAARVNGATWPPHGYKRAKADAALALRLEELLRSANEGSAIDSSYHAFVLAPGAEMPGEEDALNKRADATLADAAELLGVGVESFYSDEDKVGKDSGDEENDAFADGEQGDEGTFFNVLLHPDAEDLSQKNPNWWSEFYEKAEYEGRKAASELMNRELSDVHSEQIPYGRAWNHAIYSGTSKSGAEVGVMAVRFDEEDDFED